MNTSFRRPGWKGLFLLLLLIARRGACADEPTEKTLASAQALLHAGKYAEADESFRALPATAGAAAALGTARCQHAVGQRDQAVETLTKALAAYPQAADLPAELARLAYERGDYAAAQQQTAAALKLDADEPLAHWVQAEVDCALGKLTEANTEYQALVNLYNRQPKQSAERLHWIGLGAAEFARWNRLTDQFSLLVNEFYPALLAADPANWEVPYRAGLLFAEKYNLADASKEFRAALELNPNAAPLYAALGELALDEFELGKAQNACDEALAINPQSLAALDLQADIHFANFDPRQAAAVLQGSLKLHPTREETLGRLAAAYAAVDGPARVTPDSRLGKLIAEVNARNAHAGAFYEALGDALDRVRRWPAAATYYDEAMTRMPQRVAPAGKLGMILMRLGEEERAKVVLDEAFKIDPFNVRVNNTLKVLEVLSAYETLETDHFRIRFDPARDTILAGYMGRWLEEVYPALVKQMGFAPPEKSLFEVFSKAKNTDGHGWFSARMVGLPNIHPIGACAGKIVALQSPNEGQQRFNWSRVLKHEFVHVINLQQTDFNIPHWFTEGLAVLNEGYARPQAWIDLLVEQSAHGKLFDLNSINLGFIRPHSSNEWTLAYCQAHLYAEYMLARYGDDAIARMLAAYADNLTTPEALERAFGTSQADFERGYQEHLKKLIAALPPSTAARELAPGELSKALAARPKDPRLLTQMAQSQLARRNYPEARRMADAALAGDPRQPLAQYVRARLHLLVGENKEALERLESALDREQPQENVLALLAGLRLKAEDYAAAADLYELGARRDPSGTKWLKSLAAVYLKSGNNRRLAEVLASLAAVDPDDLPLRKKLTRLALDQGDPAAAARWSLEALRIFVMDYQLHQWRAEALVALGDPAGASGELVVAVELEPDEPKLRLALADAYLKAKEPEKAKAALDELLAREPELPEAKKLRETIK